MLRILLLDWESRKSKSNRILIKSRTWKEESTRKCSKLKRKFRSWKMKCLISSPKPKNCRSNSKMKNWEWVQLKNSFKCIKMDWQSKWLIITWSMIRRRTKFCKVKSTTAWMILKRNSFKMSHKSMLSNNILKAKVPKVTISINFKTACNFVMRSIWILSKDVWVWHELRFMSILGVRSVWPNIGRICRRMRAWHLGAWHLVWALLDRACCERFDFVCWWLNSINAISYFRKINILKLIIIHSET